MASVPNLPTAPVVPQSGLPGAPEGDGLPADFFAQLLGGGPLVVAVAGPGGSPPAGELTLRAAPDVGAGSDPLSPDGSSPADIIPLLQAQSGFPVAVAPVAPAAPASEGAQQPAVPAARPTAAPTIDAPAARVVAPSARQSIDPAEDAGPTIEMAVAAAKTAVDKPIGKSPISKHGVKAASAPKIEAAETALAVAPARHPDLSGPRTESSPQPVTPAAGIIQPGPVAAAFAAAPVTPQMVTAVAPAADAMASVADLVVERQLDLANDSQWLDRLAREIARAGARDEPLRFRLHPQTLGHLQVEMTQSDRGATVRLTVETEAARNILLDAQPRLAAEARAQGVRLAGTEVDLGTAGQQGDGRRDAETQPRDIVRVVRGGETSSISSDPARSRPDRYA